MNFFIYHIYQPQDFYFVPLNNFNLFIDILRTHIALVTSLWFSDMVLFSSLNVIKISDLKLFSRKAIV